jgi:hypothetical protein
MKKLLVLILVTAGLSSCNFEFEKEIETDFKIGDNKLVLNSIFNDQFEASFKVYRSNAPLDWSSTDSVLSTAQLMIYEDGIFKETVPFDPNLVEFRTTFVPQEGKTYKVVGKYPGLPEVNASSRLPVKIPFASYSFQEDAGVDVNGDPQSSFTFTIPDPAGKNFYRLEFHRNGGGGFYKSEFESEDPVLKGDGFLDEEGSTKEDFNDQLFDGQQKTITIKFRKELSPTTFARYRIHLQHVSEEAYNYLSKMDLEYYSYPDPFVEPVFIYSNVQNGYGIFGALCDNYIEIQ